MNTLGVRLGFNSAVVLDSSGYSGGNAQGVGIPLAMIPNPFAKSHLSVVHD